MRGAYEEKIHEAVTDRRLQLAISNATGRMVMGRRMAVAPAVLPEYEELREHARRIKEHTLDHLDYYLEQVEANVTARGGKVVYAADGAEACDFVVRLAKQRGVKLVVKSKSMTSEEITLNDKLEAEGIEPVETDLGEYIIQLARQHPYHIIAPALHMTREDVADLFQKRLGIERETVPEKLTQIARRVLREKFLAAGMGVSGANFVIADSGAVLLVENEGNIRLTTSAPKIHVAVAGIEKVIPRTQDLAVFLTLLGRSATGQPLGVYTSFLAPPRRAGETDGPEEFYLLLLDNGRTRLLADRGKRESLYCIRCGACLNHCPVYRKIGGHSYPWVYSGPIGKILTPQYMGITHEPWLPFASSLCGACAEVCPVKINIPRILLELRSEITGARKKAGESRLERLAFRLWAWVMRHPRLYEMFGSIAAGAMGSDTGQWTSSLPPWFRIGPARAWLSQRDAPVPAERSFRQLWRERTGTENRP